MTYNAQLRACCVAWRRAGDGGVLGRCTGPSELEMAHVINQIVVVVILPVVIERAFIIRVQLSGIAGITL